MLAKNQQRMYTLKKQSKLSRMLGGSSISKGSLFVKDIIVIETSFLVYESRGLNEEIPHMGQKLKSERERVRRSLITGNYEKGDDSLELHAVENAVVTVVDPNNHNRNEFQNHGSMLPVVPVTTQLPSQKNVADEFTLNREQRVALMIVTSHLDGYSRSRTGTCVVLTLIT